MSAVPGSSRLLCRTTVEHQLQDSPRPWAPSLATGSFRNLFVEEGETGAPALEGCAEGELVNENPLLDNRESGPDDEAPLPQRRLSDVSVEDLHDVIGFRRNRGPGPNAHHRDQCNSRGHSGAVRHDLHTPFKFLHGHLEPLAPMARLAQRRHAQEAALAESRPRYGGHVGARVGGPAATHRSSYLNRCPEMAAIEDAIVHYDPSLARHGSVDFSRLTEVREASSPSEHWGTVRRLGFPCSSVGDISDAEATALPALSHQATMCDQLWTQALRGVAILGSVTVETAESLRKLARKYGVPSHLRHLMWATLSGVSLRLDENEGFFRTIVRQFGLVSGPSQDVIEKDLERTFPDHPYFAAGEPGTHRLRLILHALCWRNPLLGYCQSFNFIAAVLLLVLNDDEAAFFLMCHILEHLLPNDYYSEGLVGVKIDQRVFVQLMDDLIPRIAQHFRAINFDVCAIIPAWLMSLFVNTFPIETVLRVWDYMVTDRSTHYSSVPIATALAILKLNQEALLQIADAGEVMVFLNRAAACWYDGARLVRTAVELEIRPAALHNHRRRIREEILIESERRRQAMAALELSRAARAQALAAAEAQSLAAQGYPTDGAAPTGQPSIVAPGAAVSADPAAVPSHRSPSPEATSPPEAEAVAPRPLTAALHHTHPHHPANATSRRPAAGTVFEMQSLPTTARSQ